MVPRLGEANGPGAQTGQRPRDLYRRKHRGFHRCATAITERKSLIPGALLVAAAEQTGGRSKGEEESPAGNS
jgi:hypothetical protein